ncbi:Hsp33 family molecular chaperone HslO [bacterium]|nr:Hsp33 family molecular chaperone HslO [bacterium]
MSKAYLYKFMNSAGTIRASSIVCTEILNHLRTVQQTSPTSTLALGRTLVGTTLLAAQLKDEQALSVQIHCDGAMKMVFAQASYEGSVRAFIAEPQLPMSVERGNLILAPHVGQGTLTVSTYIKGAARPQISQVLVESGEITEDLASYIRISQQIPCMLSTGVVLGSEGVVNSAGGLLVEMMPGHTEEEVARVESSLRALGALSQSLTSGVRGEELLRLFFVGYEGNYWKHPHSVEISCSCSVDKVLGSFQLLGEEEIKKMIVDKEVVDVQCEMCGKRYRVDHNRIKELYQSLKKLH